MNTGTIRPMQPKAKQTLELRASIHNRFDVEVIDAATGEVKQKARGFNVVCKTLWDRVLNVNTSSNWAPQPYFYYILFGGGSGTPSASDTALFSLIGAKSIQNSITRDPAVETGVISQQGVVTLQAEEYVGDTLTEVGLGYDATHIVTHALLQDMNGNPISIEKTATDVIKIYATIYVHFPAGGWYGGAVTVAPIDVDFNGSFFYALLGNQSRNPRYFRRGKANKRTGAGTAQGTVNNVSPAVNRADRSMAVTVRIAAADQNMPIRSIQMATYYSESSSYFVSPFLTFLPFGWFTPPEIRGEPIGTGDGTATEFSTAFPVLTPSKVYVDGVEAAGVTFRAGPSGTSLTPWLNQCYRTDAGTPGYFNTAFTFYNEFAVLSSLAPGEKSPALENPFNALGVEKLRCSSPQYSGRTFNLLVSDDLANWDVAGTFTLSAYGITDCAVPAAYQSKRFWVIENADTSNLGPYVDFVSAAGENNIVFSNPPAAGAVITADYTPDCIAKDENHVFDLTLELTLGEYSEA